MICSLFYVGHEALSSLVDVAVQQPLLPVPHKDEKGRNPMPTEQMMALQQLRQVRIYGEGLAQGLIGLLNSSMQMEMQRRPGGMPPSQQMYLREQQMQLDHMREMEHKQREQREREHLAEREREQRERDRQERERSIMAAAAERDRSLQADRDRERLSSSGSGGGGRPPSLYEEQDDRRRYGNPGQQPPFARDR